MPPEQHPPGSSHTDTLSPAETRQALWVAAIAWGVFGSAWLSLTSGAPFVTFARSLGASTFYFGLLNSLPFLGVLAQLPSAYLVERRRRRKWHFIVCGVSQRLTWLLLAALPWAIPGRYGDLRLGALLALLVMASALGNAASPVWLSWFADIMPAERRARYLGKRAALATVTSLIAAGVVGWVLDRNTSFPVFTAVFSIAAVLGMGDILLFLLVRETPMDAEATAPCRLRDVARGPLADTRFRGYLLYAFSESVVFGIAGPFFWLLGLEVLDIGSFWANWYIMMVPMMFTAVTLPLWGGVCDRFGSKPLVAFGTLASTAFPALWLVATKDHFHLPLAVGAVIGGSFVSAIQAADMNMIFELTPRRNRSIYLAALSVAASMGWVIAPAAGGAIAQLLKPVQVSLLGRTFGSLHALMAISVAVRIVHTLVVVPRLPEEPRGSLRGLALHLLKRPPALVASLFQR